MMGAGGHQQKFSGPKSSGHLRFVTFGQYQSHFVKKIQPAPAGTLWRASKLSILVKFKIYSLEQQMRDSMPRDFTPKLLAQCPTTALFFVAESFFVVDDFKSFSEIVLNTAEIANWILEGQSFFPASSHRPSLLDKAKGGVRSLYAAKADQAALLELKK